jgi:serine O-acetyltransferase
MFGLLEDAIELSRVATGSVDKQNVLRSLLLDSFAVLALSRVREAARRYHIVGLNRALRLTQTALYAIEIGKDVEMGKGVYFVHTVGTVLGGNAQIGARVRFMGNNTIGTAKDNGYPIIEDDVVVGCGARVLGPVRVGARATIGANAVVLNDVPPDTIVIGAPARPVQRTETKVQNTQPAAPGS